MSRSITTALDSNDPLRELVCFTFSSADSRNKGENRRRTSPFASVDAPPDCKEYRFPVKRFMSARRARAIVDMLNSQRRAGRRNPRPTLRGVASLLAALSMGSRDTPVARRIRILFLDRPFRPLDPEDPDDRIDTASTNGKFLKIYTGIITDEEFERQPGHLGRKRPSWVSHYAAVILHEVGHIVHKRFRTGGRREVRRVMGSLYRPRCFLDPGEFESKRDWAEWFADMFTLSLITLAAKA